MSGLLTPRPEERLYREAYQCFQAEEANQCLKEACREVDSLASELTLELSLASIVPKKPRHKRSWDKAAMAEHL
ncbi:hypothetical protein GW17_00051746 [Ensete ventricosum]|nr:hypothetical protein GW17_00051746 [Ensete ventricosum]